MANYGLDHGLTDWEEAQIRIGNMKAPEPKDTGYDPIDYDVSIKGKRNADALAALSSDELDDTLDEDDEDERAMLEAIRAKRLAQLQAKATSGAGVREIAQSDYVREVSEHDGWVILHLYQSDIPACGVVHRAMTQLATTRAVNAKFLRIVSTAAIPDYPNAYVPTVFIFNEKDLVSKMVSIKGFPGEGSFNADDLEWKLASLGAMETDMEEDPRAAEEEFDRRRLHKSSFIGVSSDLI